MRINGLLEKLCLSILSCVFVLETANASGYHYKSERLLSFPEGKRDWFYNGAFMSIGHVVSLKNKEQGDCVWNWYFENPTEKVEVIEKVMKRFPDHSPTAIFIGLLEKDCGKFDR